jgi:hypothetical protein
MVALPCRVQELCMRKIDLVQRWLNSACQTAAVTATYRACR